MRTKLLLFLALLWLGLAAGSARAAVTCTVTANNLASASNYDPFVSTFNDSGGSFSVNCTRTTGGGNRFTSLFYVGADNGIHYSGSSRRLANGTNFLNYALFQNYAGCSTVWGQTATTVYTLNNSNTGPNDIVTNPNPLANGRSYCFRITGGVNTAPPGVYTDTLTIGVADGNGTVLDTVTLQLSTTVQASCRVTSAPTAFSFNYTSFQTSAPTSTHAFQMRCTNTTTYTLGFDTPVVGTNDKVLGLNYTLTTSLTGTGTGNGTVQNYNVTATIPANQAGTCNKANGVACAGTVTRAVQISY